MLRRVCTLSGFQMRHLLMFELQLRIINCYELNYEMSAPSSCVI